MLVLKSKPFSDENIIIINFTILLSAIQHALVAIKMKKAKEMVTDGMDQM